MKILIFAIFFLEFICICYAENVKKSVDNLRADNGDDNGDNGESKDVAMQIPDIESDNRTHLCSTRRVHHNMHPIINATAKQFPFMAAMLSLSGEHLCSGSIIANGLILTTASCADKQINAVLLNTLRAKKDNKYAVRLSVISSEKFPSYSGEESLNNVAVVYTMKHNASVASGVRVSNYTSTQNLIDLEIFGYGLNDKPGEPKELQYVGVENRFQSPPGNLLNVYIDCVESKVPTCFSDYGGPAIFGNELVGIVVKGNEECIKEMTSNYATNKEMATVLPTYSFKHWLDEKVKKHDEQNTEAIATYPSKLVGMVQKEAQRMTPEEIAAELKKRCGKAAEIVAPIFSLFLVCTISLFFH